jgi:hypothetical protein
VLALNKFPSSLIAALLDSSFELLNQPRQIAPRDQFDSRTGHVAVAKARLCASEHLARFIFHLISQIFDGLATFVHRGLNGLSALDHLDQEGL